MLYLNWGDPLTLERLMETVKAFDERIILRNPQGHLLFSSNWFGGNKVYREPNWQWQKPYSFPVLHPAFLLGQYNADPTGRGLVIGLADGYLAHAGKDDKGRFTLPNEINWASGATRGGELNNGSGSGDTMHTFWAAWRWSGDAKYLQALDYRVARGGPGALANLGENVVDVLGRQQDWYPLLRAEADAGKTGFASLMAWQASGDRSYIAALHADGLQAKVQRAYMNTEGHWWSDRVEAPSEFLQRARLGGIALKRNQSWPGHTVSWRFDRDGAAEQVALLVHAPSRERFTVTSYNLGTRTIGADMTGWNVASGTGGYAAAWMPMAMATSTARPPNAAYSWKPALRWRCSSVPGVPRCSSSNACPRNTGGNTAGPGRGSRRRTHRRQPAAGDRAQPGPCRHRRGRSNAGRRARSRDRPHGRAGTGGTQ